MFSLTNTKKGSVNVTVIIFNVGVSLFSSFEPYNIYCVVSRLFARDIRDALVLELADRQGKK